MTSLKTLFRVNADNSNSSSATLEVLFDFAVIVTVSLIFNGFIINSHVAPLHQMFHMVFAAGLLATNWYIHIFFKQRYEKKGMFFRILTFVKILALGIMAASLDLMVFRLNNDEAAQHFLYYFAPMLFACGLIFSRLISAVEYTVVWWANRDIKPLIHLSIAKALSRMLVVVLAITHLIIIALFHDKFIEVTTFVFMPLYLIIEMVGNFVGVTNKNLQASPEISVKYAKERFSKLNILYISSLVVSGTIQFAYYFKHSSDLYMIIRFICVYATAFLLWWMYVDRVYRFDIKISAWNIIAFTTLSTIVTMAFAVFGGLYINMYNDENLKVIYPCVFFGLAFVLLIYNVMLKFVFSEGFSSALKWKLVTFSFWAIGLLIALGIASFFELVPVYACEISLIGTLLVLNLFSRTVIAQSKKSVLQ